MHVNNYCVIVNATLGIRVRKVSDKIQITHKCNDVVPTAHILKAFPA